MVSQWVLQLTSLEKFFHRRMISSFLTAIYIVYDLAGANNQHPALLQRWALNSLLQITGAQSTDSRFQRLKSYQ